MLLSFDKCSVAALTVPIYKSVEGTLKEKTRFFHLNFVFNYRCVTAHLSFVCKQIPRDSQ